MAIRLTTFGGLRAHGDEAELDWLLSQRLRAALFVYLAVERRASREALTAAFWPESDEENARHALRQTLYHLRKALGSGWLESRAHELRVSSSVHTDAGAFDAALERRDAEAAARLYAGPFLDGVNLVDLKAWESWVDGRRTRYARAFRKACREWLEARRAAGDLAGAVEAAHCWMAPDPFDDEAQHKLIEALADAGERAEAIRQYETYARLLEPDGLRPLDETVALVERVRAEAAAWPANGSPQAGAIPVAGRPDAGVEPGASPASHARPDQPRRDLVALPPSSAVTDQVSTVLTRSDAAHARRPVVADPVGGRGEVARTRKLRRRRILTGLSSATIAGAALGAMWLAPLLQAEPLDPLRVVVFPLVATDRQLAESGAGWDVALAIGAAFEHAGPLRWIDAWPWLPLEQRADPAKLTASLARRIARDRGARYYVEGVIHETGQEPVVTLKLHDVADDLVVTQQSASGATIGDASLAGIGLQAAVGVLQKLLAPDRNVDITPIAERAPAAIALWIQGEHEYRRARFEPAMNLFRRALDNDSLLVFAAIKGALAAGWLEGDPDHAGMLSLALRHDTLLPPKYRVFARGLVAYDEGSADTALARFNEALARDPDWSEAWMALGEVHYHLLPGTLVEPAGPGDSVAVDAFRRAATIDTSFSPPLVHLAEHAARTGDIDELELIANQLERRGAPRLETEQLALLLECHRHGAEAFVRMSADPNRLGMAARTLASGARTDCAKAGFRRILEMDNARRDYRFGALVGLNGLLLAQARYAEARQLLDEARSGDLPVDALLIFDALVGAPLRVEAAAAVERYHTTYGDAYLGARPDVLWLLGVWHARAGDVQRAQSLADALEREASKDGNASLSMLATAVRAHAALAEGDTTRTLILLRDLRSVGPGIGWSSGPPLGLERLLLAELLVARQEYKDAQSAASALDHHAPIMFLPLLQASLVVRTEAAEAVGLAHVASAHRARLEALRSAADKGL